ncbi:hypothetical protein ACTXT7_001863 [Hymenolepis weldensis]
MSNNQVIMTPLMPFTSSRGEDVYLPSPIPSYAQSQSCPLIGGSLVSPLFIGPLKVANVPLISHTYEIHDEIATGCIPQYASEVQNGLVTVNRKRKP